MSDTVISLTLDLEAMGARKELDAVAKAGDRLEHAMVDASKAADKAASNTKKSAAEELKHQQNLATALERTRRAKESIAKIKMPAPPKAPPTIVDQQSTICLLYTSDAADE